MTGLARSAAFIFVAAGVVFACSSSDNAKPAGNGNIGGNNSSSGNNSTSGGAGTVTVPCGGAGQGACGGAGCKTAEECASGQCDPTGKCTTPAPVPPSATDGKKDGTETDVDCGGDAAPKCADTKNCGTKDDCTSGVCATTCQVPSATDGVKNGDETDIDCGGTTTKAPGCDTGKACKVHEDCKSNGCDDTNKCALGRSCTQTNGGLTCGTGETEDANHQFDSCCTALPVPGSPSVMLDKYEVTAGRMRAFITRVNGDVKTWYTTNKATLDPKAVTQLDAYVGDLPTSIEGDGSTELSSAKLQLGAFIFLQDRPSTSQGCYVGNAGDQGFGSHTYFDGADEGEDRAYDQNFLDTLALNCVPYPLMAAFCAWDGGRLQTWEENNAAYGTGKYPWGNSPEAGGFQNYPTQNDPFIEVGPGALPFAPATTPAYGACPSCDATMMNWSNAYQHPETGNKPWDLANFIAPPGRFPKDKGAGGHMDLGGNMLELTGSPAVAIPGDNGTDPEYGAKIRWSRSGSWEGHQANNPNWQFAIMTKYGKTGGRCAHDL